MDTNQELTDPELALLRGNKESGYNYRLRREEDWTENYTLYRDRVTINRLTQRQSVNLPLMKQTIRTLLKDVDDMPVLYFQNLDNDEEAQTFQNAYWEYILSPECNNAEVKDIVDKKQVFLYGRSFDQWQIVNGKVNWEIEDPQDILVDRYCDPANLDSARYLIHTHIFKPLSSLEHNLEYNQEAVAKLKQFYATQAGLVKAADNLNMLTQKNKKMEDMGLTDVENPVLGETYVELSMHFVYRYEDEKGKKTEEEQLFKYVEADDMVILSKKPQDVVVGKTIDDYWKTHFLYTSWADDVERQDFWNDACADIVRTPNKVLNSWFSQEVENRTMRNFNMHYFNSNLEGFAPQTYEPMAWGWYGIPLTAGQKIGDVLQTVEIPQLNGNLDDMTFLTTMIEKATGATATQQGVQTENKVTLGEVQLALGEAKERIKGMSKFYTPAWKVRGQKFLKLIEAAADKIDAVKIHKQGRNTTNMFTREIAPKDWMTKTGYAVKVWSQDEKKANDTDTINKLNAVKLNIPGNPKLDEIYQRKLLEFADLTPDEINAIMEFEKQKREALMGTQGIAPLMPPNPMGQPAGKPPMNPQAPQGAY